MYWRDYFICDICKFACDSDETNDFEAYTSESESDRNTYYVKMFSCKHSICQDCYKHEANCRICDYDKTIESLIKYIDNGCCTNKNVIYLVNKIKNSKY